ncbi:hypothetical protein WISP_33008 [Willisornis vidua]|uniref:Uncharacterized protein n=1 Tax=Willisornis vidua TaxID=1566151 RepID=A0ABQ9DPV2_9PASS|nr:hypothetical protein WISP_33008 [Willisornis vidua]
MVKTMVKQAVLLQPMEDHRDSEIHLWPLKHTHTGVGGCLKEGYEPMGNPCWRGLLVGTCRPMEERNRFPGKTCDPVGAPHCDRLCMKDCILWKVTYTGAVCGELLPVGWSQVEVVHGGLFP